MEASEQKATEVVEKNVVTVATQLPSDKKSNMIQVSSNKRPLYFYVNLAKVHSLSYLPFFCNFSLSDGIYISISVIMDGCVWIS
jgi:hypothetical protein